MIITLEVVREWVTARMLLLHADSDRGEIPAKLVWMGAMVALAIAAAAVVTAWVMGKANSITLQ